MASVLAVTLACHRTASPIPASEPNRPAQRALPPLAVDRLYILESGGTPPEDTVVVYPAGAPRVIVLRRGPPDNGVFATLRFPVGSLAAAAGRDSIRITVRPRPGVFGLDLETDAAFVRGAEVEFSYAVHFISPAGARARYGSDIGFERELSIGRMPAGGLLSFLPTARSAADNLSAPLVGPGRYLVAAPR